MAACRTKRGYNCVFPFTYRNVSLDGTVTDVVYRGCSSLDIYTPWCPTALDPATGDILSWDECLDDCPAEVPEVVCQTDPPFPAFALPGTNQVNFTTDYEAGEGGVTREVNRRLWCLANIGYHWRLLF